MSVLLLMKLTALKTFLNSIDYNLIIICGDFNTTLNGPNAQNNYLTVCITRINACVTWDHPTFNVDLTCTNLIVNLNSNIDHVIVDSKNIFDSIDKMMLFVIQSFYLTSS